MKKGIFWCDSFGRDSPHLIVVSVKCDADGKSDRPIDFSSKSGQNFNHKAEWQKLSRSVTRGQPFNYYPRGRVEIKNRQNRLSVFYKRAKGFFDKRYINRRDVFVIGKSVAVYCDIFAVEIIIVKRNNKSVFAALFYTLGDFAGSRGLARGAGSRKHNYVYRFIAENILSA